MYMHVHRCALIRKKKHALISTHTHIMEKKKERKQKERKEGKWAVRQGGLH